MSGGPHVLAWLLIIIPPQKCHHHISLKKRKREL